MRRFLSDSNAAPADAGRRLFLVSSAAFGAGLAIGFAPGMNAAEAAAGAPFAPNPFVRIGTDGTVTVIAKHLEMGQGIYTGLATILAEELDADWSSVKVESAPADAKTYANLMMVTLQATGGSSSVFNSWEQLRKAGATARAMLVEAAAQKWKVPAAEITVSNGVVSHAASKKQAKFGALVADAAKLPVPQEVTLKDPSAFTLIGKSAPRVDSASKTDGSAQFTLDVKMPGMLTAMLVQPPAFGATVKSFDAARAKAVSGVVDVVQISRGVAVVAENTWAAMKGREALSIEWDFAKADTRDSAQHLKDYQAALQKPGAAAERKGDAAAALAAAKTKLEAEYVFPYLAHAPMEPLNCVAQITPEGCTITTGAQFQTVDQMLVGQLLGIQPAQVKINTLMSGGSFGRRAVPDSDYIIQAVEIAKVMKTDKPVKLVWTREDDMRGGRYRPMVAHKVSVGLDAAGAITGWQSHIVGQSILAGTPFAQFAVKDGVDGSLVEGAANADYGFANSSVDCTLAQSPITVLWWRSVGHTHTAYVVETMVDEAAKVAGQDPLAYRQALLKEKPRHLAVLQLLGEKSGWGSALSNGVHRGLAIHESFRTVVGQVAEVEIVENRLRVKRVVCVVDCGTAVNPDVVKAQMEGGIGFALSAALFDELTLGDGGRVEQTNFDSYRILRMSEMPKIEVHIVPSTVPPTGVGEPGVPPLAPAVANAIAAATGKRIRQLPFAKHFDI